MDDVLLLEAAERYLNGGMTSDEAASFELLRKNNPEADQLVVEHIYFLQSIGKHADVKVFKNMLKEVDAKLTEDGVIKEPAVNKKTIVVSFWNKYKRNIAVAASIAGFISLLTSGLMATYTKKTVNNDYSELVNKLDHEIMIRKIKDQRNATMPVKPEVKFDYRATGFLVDGSGYLVTNAHVLNKIKNIYVENSKGDYYSAAAVYIDDKVDLAVLRITDTSFRAVANLPYSIKKTNADLGEQFFTLGFPRNEIVYGEGYVSAKSGSDGDSTAYQLTVSANPGNSGGPVINRNGELIGIITAKDAKSDGVVYAAKASNIFKLVEQMKKDDAQFKNIKTPAGNELKKADRLQQIKKMEDMVYMVVGSHQ